MLKFHKQVDVVTDVTIDDETQRTHTRQVVELKLRGGEVGRALRGDLEEAAALLGQLSLVPDSGFAEDVAGYVGAPYRNAVAEYLELMARKLREEKD
jgi:hypothetical protein